MSENGFSDVSRIVSLIMENPKLIEEISNLARKDTKSEDEKSDSESSIRKNEDAQKDETVSAPPVSQPTRRAPRAELLCALKPYISKERANAIDSMISISEILDMMKSR